MTNYVMDCIVCCKPFNVFDTYGTNKCSHCDQKYCYDEGQAIVLNREQIKILRDAKGLDYGKDIAVQTSGKSQSTQEKTSCTRENNGEGSSKKDAR